MGRLLNHVSLETDIRLISIAGGTKNNVISSECKAEILVAKEDADKVKSFCCRVKSNMGQGVSWKEPGLTVDVERRKCIWCGSYERGEYKTCDHIFCNLPEREYSVMTVNWKGWLKLP